MKEVQKIGGQKALNALNALSVRHLRNVPGRRPKKKKKAMKEVQKIGGQKALNALNALSVHHLRNVPGRRLKKKKKMTKETKKREEATKISCPILHEKLRHRSKGGGSKVDLVSDRLIFLLTFY